MPFFKYNLFILIYHKETLIYPEFNCETVRILIFIGDINRAQHQAVSKCAVNCSANLFDMMILLGTSQNGQGFKMFNVI